MKNLLLIFVFCFGPHIFGQVSIDSLSGTISLRNVHKVEGNAKALKIKASEWTAKAYNDSNNAIKLSSEDKIISKGSFEVGADYSNLGITVFTPRKIDYILELDFKDNRYRIEITNISSSAQGYEHNEIPLYISDFDFYKSYYQNFIDGYKGSGKKAMQKRLENEKKSKKDYQALVDFGTQIINQISKELNRIDRSLFVYMTSEQDDDW